MTRKRPWMTPGDFVKWEKYNRRRSTVRESKKPFEKRMQEEWELEKKMEKEQKKGAATCKTKKILTS
jgi:hypothetical protein